MSRGHSSSLNPSGKPTRLAGTTSRLTLPVFNDWPRISLPVDSRGSVLGRAGANDAKFLTKTADQGSETVSTCGGNSGLLPHCLESIPRGRMDRRAEVLGNGIVSGIHETTTEWLLIFRSTKLCFYLDLLQAPQIFPTTGKQSPLDIEVRLQQQASSPSSRTEPMFI